MMFKGFDAIANKQPQARLVIVGDGPEKQTLLDLVSRLNIEENVIFTGFIPNPVDCINLLDVFLLTSFSEGTSMTLLEVMGAGKPCIVTDVGGNPEIKKDGEVGIVVPSDDELQLAPAMTTLITGPDTLASMSSQASSRFTTNFTVESMINHIRHCYANALSVSST